MHHRITRTIAAVALSGASLISTGAALVANAAAASADNVDTNVCSSAAANLNYSTGVATGTLSGCQQRGSATDQTFTDLNKPNAPTSGTIHWATGNATTHIIITSVPDSSVPCPAGFAFGTDSNITVVDGPYGGSTGFEASCSDFSAFPIVHIISVGPVLI
jgi:hypothetical protein